MSLRRYSMGGTARAERAMERRLIAPASGSRRFSKKTVSLFSPATANDSFHSMHARPRWR